MKICMSLFCWYFVQKLTQYVIVYLQNDKRYQVPWNVKYTVLVTPSSETMPHDRKGIAGRRPS